MITKSHSATQVKGTGCPRDFAPAPNSSSSAVAGPMDEDEDEDGDAGRGGVGEVGQVDGAQLAAGFRSFVDYMSSGLEGAEVPGDEGDVNFDPSAFLSELQKALGSDMGEALMGLDLGSKPRSKVGGPDRDQVQKPHAKGASAKAGGQRGAAAAGQGGSGAGAAGGKGAEEVVEEGWRRSGDESS